MNSMKRMIGGIAACALMAGAAQADTSPARAQLEKFVAAFNAGDWDTIAAFAQVAVPKRMVESGFIKETIAIREDLGELAIVDVSELSPYKLTSRVRDRDTGGGHEISLLVSSEPPHRIESIFIANDSPKKDRAP
jgi:hypothetical protein